MNASYEKRLKDKKQNNIGFPNFQVTYQVFMTYQLKNILDNFGI